MGLTDALYGVAWAIRPEALAALCALADRQDVDAAALAATMHHSQRAQEEALARVRSVDRHGGQPLEKAQTAYRRGATAVIPVTGPIVRYASLFSSASGGTSVETLARDFTVALDDPKTRAILLSIDSPGGEVAGIAEMADMIHAARAVKPVWAYVSDLGASAGYWLASAADRIVVAETAALGSIGVVAAVRDPRASKQGEIEFVSSVSPNKRADPTTEAGAAQLQDLVDTLGDIFVGAVARNRGTDRATVVGRYGAGGLLIGARAVDAGLADALGSFEGTLDDLTDHLAARDEEAAAEPAPTTPARTPRTKGHAVTATLRASFARFLARLDPPDADALADALDGVSPPPIAVAAAQTEPATPPEDPPMPEPQSTANAAAAHSHSTLGGQPVADDVPPAIANRLALLEAENARLHADRIQSAATAFAEEQVRGMRALPAQADTIVALHAALAADDERFKAIVRADGSRVLRTTLLANFFAAQPDRSILANEMLEAAGGKVVYDRATASRPDPNAPATAEELAGYLNQTPTGRAALARAAANGTNGAGH